MTTADYLLSTRDLRRDASGHLRGALNAMGTHRGACLADEYMLYSGPSLKWISGVCAADRHILLNTERANAVIANLNTGNQP